MTKEELHTLARSVAPHLSGFAYLDKRDAGEQLYWFATLAHPELGLVEFQSDGKGKLVVHGSCSDLPGFRHSSGIRRPSIRVGADRAPHLIAREVERRLLPELAKVRIEAKAHLRATAEHDAGMAAAKRHLIEHGRGHEYNDGRFTLHGMPGYGDAHLQSPNRVVLDFRVTPSVAAMVVDVLRAVKFRSDDRLHEAAECELRVQKFLTGIEPGAFHE